MLGAGNRKGYTGAKGHTKVQGVFTSQHRSLVTDGFADVRLENWTQWYTAPPFPPYPILPPRGLPHLYMAVHILLHPALSCSTIPHHNKSCPAPTHPYPPYPILTLSHLDGLSALQDINGYVRFEADKDTLTMQVRTFLLFFLFKVEVEVVHPVAARGLSDGNFSTIWGLIGSGDSEGPRGAPA